MNIWIENNDILFSFFINNLKKYNEKIEINSYSVNFSDDNIISVRLYYYYNKNKNISWFLDRDFLSIDFIFFLRKQKLLKLNENIKI